MLLLKNTFAYLCCCVKLKVKTEENLELAVTASCLPFLLHGLVDSDDEAVKPFCRLEEIRHWLEIGLDSQYPL